ncbi:MAG: DUF6341 family protein [Marinirhabdus sp.]
MQLKDVFYWTQDVFENVLFAPYDMLRFLEVDSWWLANSLSWVFAVIGFGAFLYWMKQLKIFNENNEEDRSSTSHSFLG